MSTTMTMSFPPPTLNTLAPSERTRLLRSTRKLGKVLGATPLVIDTHTLAPRAESPANTSTPTQKTAYSPSTPVLTPARRAVRLFSSHTPSSSISSMASVASEPEYVVVRPAGPRADYQPTNELYGGRRSAEEMRTVSGREARDREREKESKKRKPLGALQPVTIVFDTPSSTRQQTLGSAPSAAQPLLLRVRPSGDSVEQSTLSPLSAVFSINAPTTPTSPTMTITPSVSPVQGMNDRERRRKMAKLARTLGENVPPELVFRPVANGSSGRERSTSVSKTARRASVALTSRPSIPRFPPQPPVLAVSATPVPVIPIQESPTNATPEAPKRMKKNRPRSLTLGTASAVVAAARKFERLEKEKKQERPEPVTVLPRGTQSMDSPRPEAQRPTQPPSHSRTLSRAELPLRIHSRGLSRMNLPAAPPAPLYPLPDAPFSIRVDPPADESVPMEISSPVDYGRRKEREWSGEWNVRDMEDVARKLRELRGR